MAGVLVLGPGRRECRFHNLYKKKGPAWKEKFYKRCVERLKTSRESEVNRHRAATSSPLSSSPELESVVRRLMKEEWFLFIRDDVDVGFPEFDATDFEESKLMEEIENELRSAEEEMIIQEFENVSLAETSAINTSFELTSILCPVCLIERLTRLNSSISCSCGAEIRNDNLSISDLHTQLTDILQLHNSSCEFNLNFNSQSGQLIIFCSSCNFNWTIM